MKKVQVVLGLAALLTIGLLTGCSSSNPAADKAGLEEALAIADDAYVYGYPLVTMDMTRKQLTNVAVPDDSHAPMGQLLKLRTYPAVDNHTVTAPNADTLYTTAWFDVSREPWILTVPDIGKRYYLLPFLSGWTDVFEVPGSRTTGEKGGKYAITGPGWSGKLPDGVKELKSPTGMVWLLGRIYCTGTPEDYKAVHALQDKFELVPLSAYGQKYTPPDGEVDNNFDMKKGIRDQVDAMSVYEYFSYLAKLMKTNPPAAADAALVAKMAKIGIVPGQEFDSSKLDAFDKEAIRAIPKTAQVKIYKRFEDTPKLNGWFYTMQAGTYGTEYLQRAMVTMIGLGANRPQDAIYPTATKDDANKDLDASSNKYIIHFDKGQMPPAKGFWSITMYDKDFFFVPNELKRQTLSSRNKFVTNADGSVDLYLQADSPGKDKEANWLPAPKAKFAAMMRLYWPNETPPSIVDGSWKPPAITVAK